MVAGARAVSVAVVAGGAWALGGAVLERSCGATSLRGFDVSRDSSLDSPSARSNCSDAVLVTQGLSRS